MISSREDSIVKKFNLSPASSDDNETQHHNLILSVIWNQPWKKSRNSWQKINRVSCISLFKGKFPCEIEAFHAEAFLRLRALYFESFCFQFRYNSELKWTSITRRIVEGIGGELLSFLFNFPYPKFSHFTSIVERIWTSFTMHKKIACSAIKMHYSIEIFRLSFNST